VTGNLIKDNMLKESVVKNGRIKATQHYAVFGNPIHHSKSPALHQAFATQTGEDIHYTAELVDVDGFSAAADTFFASGGKGLNITVPFKINALEYADQLTTRAEKAGAVNTLIKRDNLIIGDNTDGVGFIDDVVNNLQWPLKNKNILILGAGGAVRGILDPLLQNNPANVTIANRTVEKAKKLLRDVKNNTSCHLQACHYDGINTPFDIIINGTSASLHGDLPKLPSTTVTKDSYCYDMMYSKEPTVFMRWGKQCGAKAVADGLGMLVCQGAESFYKWRGVKPQTQMVIKEIRLAL
jgi:shikimate dehydrogenase